MSISPRKIGTSFVHPIGYGAMGMSAYYGPGLSDEEAFKVCFALYSVQWTLSLIYHSRFLIELLRLDVRIWTLLLFTRTAKKLLVDGARDLSSLYQDDFIVTRLPG
jgi:hypothetical protein